MAQSGAQQGTTTVTETIKPEPEHKTSTAVKLKLHKPKNDKKVIFSEDTVDNEFMDKKKSKCCCVYNKPKLFGESSSDESDNDECSLHCRGHKKKKFHEENSNYPQDSHSQSQDEPT